MEVFSKELLMQKKNAWIRPNLTSIGTFGENDFGVYGNSSYGNAYKAVDGNLNTAWVPQYQKYQNGLEYTFYNPIPLKVTELSFKTEDVSVGTNILINGVFYISIVVAGSNDGNNYTNIKSTGYQLYTNSSYSGYTGNFDMVIDMSDNNAFYKYYKLYYELGSARMDLYMLKELEITATEQS
ncbi:hypothetical protein IJI31_06515 [bacterium]|nr:hypothetical protein [bacterium]